MNDTMSTLQLCSSIRSFQRSGTQINPHFLNSIVRSWMTD